MLRLSRNRRNQLSVGSVAASLEAADDAAEVFVHLFFNEEDAMEMVGHHLKGKNLNLWVIAGDAPPFVMHSLTKGRECHSGCLKTAGRDIALTLYDTKEGMTAFGGHGDHVDHAVSVVMVNCSTEHGGLFLTSKGFLFFVGLSIHSCKGTIKRRKEQTFPKNFVHGGL